MDTYIITIEVCTENATPEELAATIEDAIYEKFPGCGILTDVETNPPGYATGVLR